MSPRGTQLTKTLAGETARLLEVGQSLDNLMAKDSNGTWRSGIGIFFQLEALSRVYVSELTSDSPAGNSARIAVGDVLLSVDGWDLSYGIPENQLLHDMESLLQLVQDRVLGPPGSVVKLTFERTKPCQEQYQITLKRYVPPGMQMTRQNGECTRQVLNGGSTLGIDLQAAHREIQDLRQGQQQQKQLLVEKDTQIEQIRRELHRSRAELSAMNAKHQTIASQFVELHHSRAKLCAMNEKHEAIASQLAECRCARLIHRWQNAALYSAFGSWRVNARQQRRAEDVCGRLIARWSNKATTAAFDSWRCNAKAQRRAEDICSRMILRWQNAALYSAFESWRVNARQQRRAEDVCGRLIARWLNMTLDKAFDRWHWLVFEEREFLRAVAERRKAQQEEEAKERGLLGQLGYEAGGALVATFSPQKTPTSFTCAKCGAIEQTEAHGLGGPRGASPFATTMRNELLVHSSPVGGTRTSMPARPTAFLAGGAPLTPPRPVASRGTGVSQEASGSQKLPMF